jgi:hypothetical protein
MDRITVILPCTVSALLYKLQTASVQLIQAQMTAMPVGGNKKTFAGEQNKLQRNKHSVYRPNITKIKGCHW